MSPASRRDMNAAMDELIYSVIFAGIGMSIVFAVLFIYCIVMMVVPWFIPAERDRGRGKAPAPALERAEEPSGGGEDEEAVEMAAAAAAALTLYLRAKPGSAAMEIILFRDKEGGPGPWEACGRTGFKGQR